MMYRSFMSPLGKIRVAGTADAVTHVTRVAEEDTGTDNAACLKSACDAIMAYLSRRVAVIDVPVQLQGTAFQQRVWDALQRIPYGVTVSYSTIAEAIGEPKAFRAVANACAKNPVPLIIPCHRVVHKDSSISGFAWGKDAKRFLLELEQRQAASLAAA